MSLKMAFLFCLLIATLTRVYGDDLDNFDEFLIEEKEVVKPPPPVVTVADGVLQGAWQESSKGKPYAAFEGVPYGRPPIGKLKFSDPQPVEPWEGVRNATDPLIDCVQYDPFLQQVNGVEDCLFLNVYTPKNANGLQSQYPVLVFIHGGSFMYGSGAVYGPNYIMNRDMVVVTINYRLGPLGFISTGDTVAPGNVGLKDQALALQWVRQNIKAFGGDADSITLAGVSAGAASVHYHYLSPMSRGTFARAIAYSGSAFAPWAHSNKPAEKAEQLAKILDCNATSSQEIMDCLIEIPGEDIVEATTKMFDWKLELFTPFTPTVEHPETKNPFLTESPYSATSPGEKPTDGPPLLVCVTRDEGLYPAAVFQKYPELLTELADNWSKMASSIFQYKDSVLSELDASVAAKIKEHYFGSQPIGLETFKELVQALSDRLFIADTSRFAQLMADKIRQPVFMGRYSFRGEKSFSNVLTWSVDDYGVAHADDILHIFKLPYLSSKVPLDMEMTDTLIDIIHTFASTGIPKTPAVKGKSTEWLPVVPGSETLDYMEISSPSKFEMMSSSDFGNRTFWDSLGFLELKGLQKKKKN